MTAPTFSHRGSCPCGATYDGTYTGRRAFSAAHQPHTDAAGPWATPEALQDSVQYALDRDAAEHDALLDAYDGGPG